MIDVLGIIVAIIGVIGIAATVVAWVLLNYFGERD